MQDRIGQGVPLPFKHNPPVKALALCLVLRPLLYCGIFCTISTAARHLARVQIALLPFGLQKQIFFIVLTKTGRC